MPDLKFSKKLPTIRQIKNLLVLEAMKRSGNDQTHAARKLGISKGTLSGHLQKMQLAKYILVVLFYLLSSGVTHADDMEPYIKHQVVVKFDTAASEKDIKDLITSHNLTVREKIPQINYYVLELSPADTVSDIVAILADHDIVEKCEPNYVTQTQDIPNDRFFPRQWGLQNTFFEGSDIQATQAWEVESGSPDVIIAIIDMGFDYSHQDLQENLWHNSDEIPDNGKDDDNNGYIDDMIGWDFVNQSQGLDDPDCDFRNEDNDPTSKLSSHGNRVWGVLAATMDNDIGIAGVAGHCKVMLIRAGFHNTDGVAVLSSSHIVQGIIYATDNGARIINISSGSSRYSESYRAALQYAIGKGVLVVTSAGNEGVDTPCYPAAYNMSGILSVGASTSQDLSADFSNHGDWVDVSAPGQYIMTTLLDDGYGTTQGTSFAAPLAAGVAGLLISKYPSWTPAMVQDRIMNTVDICAGLSGVNITSGRINAYRALTDPLVEGLSWVTEGIGPAPAVSTGTDSGGGCFITSVM